MRNFGLSTLLLTLVLSITLPSSTPAQANTIRAVMHSDSTRHRSRLYDRVHHPRPRLHGLRHPARDRSDLQGPAAHGGFGRFRDDKLIYTFTLRDGLKWHDGAPVTAEDCVFFAEALGQGRQHGPRSCWILPPAWRATDSENHHAEVEGALRAGAGIDCEDCLVMCPS